MPEKQIAPESLVERVKRLAEKATKGEWSRIPQTKGGDLIARRYETHNQINPIGWRLICFIRARGDSLAEDEANAAFIAAARIDAPRLCDLVEELATALRGVIAVSDRATVEYDRARAALEKVKAP